MGAYGAGFRWEGDRESLAEDVTLALRLEGPEEACCVTIWTRGLQGEAGPRLEQAWHSPGKDSRSRRQAGGQREERALKSRRQPRGLHRICGLSYPSGCRGGGVPGPSPQHCKVGAGTVSRLVQGAALSPDPGSSQ